MNDDIRVKCSFPDHPKIVRLESELGPEGPLRLIYLWLWTAQNRPSGDLSHLSDRKIEAVSGWTGEPNRFVSSLGASGFLDGEPGKRSIHDWSEHNAYAAHADWRVRRAKAGARARWERIQARFEKKNGVVSDATKRRNATSIAYSNAPAPTPAPTPTRKESNRSSREAPREPAADAAELLSPEELEKIPPGLRCRNCWRAIAVQVGFCVTCYPLRVRPAKATQPSTGSHVEQAAEPPPHEPNEPDPEPDEFTDPLDVPARAATAREDRS